MAVVYVGEVGVPIRLSTGLQLDVGDTHSIVAKKPSGATVEWSATIVDSTDAQYITQDGDLDERGMWVMQYKKVSGSTIRYGKVATLKVRDLFERGI